MKNISINKLKDFVGKEVQLNGWIYNLRSVGKIWFDEDDSALYLSSRHLNRITKISKLKIKENGYITKESKIEEQIAGEIIHLNKDFNFNLDIDYLSFVKTLHPTPAIAGIPLDKSLAIIQDLEIHNRELYCGFLGTVDSKNCDLKVNLRCARLSAKEVQIFVGGGITSKSNPNDEFKETEIKSQTLLSVIKKK